MVQKRYTKLAGCVGLGILGASFLFTGIHILQNKNSGERMTEESIKLGDVPTESLRFSKRIKEIGAEKTYEEFKKVYRDEPFDSQHGIAHVMGELLYANEGLRGIGICDSSFAFGCYHSFFSKVFSNYGEEMIDDLAAMCEEKYKENKTGCEHGIGHGILEYMGSDALVKALDACKKTRQANPFFGCTSGVFMENNNRTFWEGGNARSEMRKLNKDDPYEPCDTIVPKEFRESCYFEISLWWKEVYHHDFTKIGSLCSKLLKEQEQAACFLGTGTVVSAVADFAIEKTISLCREMGEGEDLCRIAASWRFSSLGSAAREEGKKLCDGVTPHGEYRCTVQ